MPAESAREYELYNGAQFRMDLWDALQQQARWAHGLMRGGADAAAPLAKLRETLGALRRLEAYWAAPGVGAVEDMERIARTGDLAALLQRAGELSRPIIGDTKRRRPAPPAGRTRTSAPGARRRSRTASRARSGRTAHW